MATLTPGPSPALTGEGRFLFRDVDDFHNFVAVVVDGFDGDLTGLRYREGAADGLVEGGPGGFVDLGAEGSFELVVGLGGAGEVGVADEEGLAGVVGVDEPAGEPLRR